MSVRDVLARTDLASVLTELSGEPTSAGRLPRWRCCDRNHDDEHPSVTMHRANDGVERWKCWSGGHGGTAVDAVMAGRGVNTADAVRYLEQRAGMATSPPPAAPRRVVEPPKALSQEARSYAAACASRLWAPEGAAAHDWLRKRGITNRVLTDNLVGFDPGAHVVRRADGLPRGPAVTYASFDRFGGIVYVQARNLGYRAGVSGNPEVPFKYTNPSGVHGTLPRVVFPRGPLVSGPLIVTEGIPDGLVAVSAGFRAASVISAASAVHPEVAAALADVAGGDGVILAFDRDRAGTDAQEGLAKLLAERGARCQLLQLPGGQDLTDTYMRGRAAPVPMTHVPAAGR